MGNSASSSESTEDDQSFAGKVRIVATQFILTQDYKSMRDMASNPSYCNQILQLAQKLIKQNMTAEQLKAFAQQLRGGPSVAAAASGAEAAAQQPPQQQADCAIIAEYFTLVAHLFAAIMTTVNPVFYYKNKKGQRQTQTLQTKQYLPDYGQYGQYGQQQPEKSQATYVVEGSFCTRRIDALTSDNFSKTHDKNVDDVDKIIDDMVLTPQLVCNQIEEEQRKDRFNSEIGLAELDKLYDYDDPATTNMSRGQDQWIQEEQQQIKKETKLADLGRFYQAVMGETDSIVLPSGVRKFADIDLTASLRVKSWKKDMCDNTIGKGTIITATNANAETRNLFEQYGAHVRNMMNFNESQKELLLKQLNELFTIQDGNNTPQMTAASAPVQEQQQAQQQQQQDQAPKKVVTMNEGITLENVKAMIVTTRNIILNLYITCESSFLDGLELYEAIIEQRVLNKTTEDDNGLETLIHKILTNGMQPPPPTTTSTSTTAAIAQQAQAQQAIAQQAQATEEADSTTPIIKVKSAPPVNLPAPAITKADAKPCSTISTQPQCDDKEYRKINLITGDCKWNPPTGTCDTIKKTVQFADEVEETEE
jgi:hypothetical protein